MCFFVVVVAGVLVEVCFGFILNKSNNFQSLIEKKSLKTCFWGKIWLEIGNITNISSLKDEEALLESISFHFLTDSGLAEYVHFTGFLKAV